METTTLESALRRLIAPNPSPMTERGTNTYLVGGSEVAVIDPGPDDTSHLEAILAALEGARVAAILVTHAHLDHSALAPRLAARTRAPVLAFGGAGAGRAPEMAGLEGIGGGEGLDHAFAPDETLADGEALSVDGTPIEAIWTPGHLGSHLAFLWNGAAFSGDLVMGWASSLVSPPDGDVRRFMTSCRALAARGPRILYPGHGAPVADPQARIGWLIAHREARDAQVLEALGAGPLTARDVASRIYADLPPELLPSAERNVLAHMIDLHRRDRIAPGGIPGLTTPYARQ